MEKQKVIIMGAAGRDFHNFNIYFRGNEIFDVVAFTAAQIFEKLRQNIRSLNKDAVIIAAESPVRAE